MQDADLIRTIRAKYIAIITDLDERGMRRWVALEAMSIGRGGTTAVSKATGTARGTIRKGIAEVSSSSAISPDRQRSSGGGRKAREVEQPDLLKAFEKLID